MVTIAIVLIVLGCAAFQYFKGTFVRSFATFIVTICACIIAFSFFEVLAALLIGGRDSSFKFIPPPWMQTLVFMLLFLFSFALLQTLAQYLTRREVNLGLWPERVGRAVCGVLSGLVLSSFLITAAAMSPLPNKYPYPRFDRNYPDAWRPNKVVFNADALAPGLFSTISSGSLSGKRSFAIMHPDFLDQLFLNRHGIEKDVLTITREQAITVPRKNAAWHAPEDIKDSQGNTISLQTGYNLMLVRVGLKKSALAEAGKFTPSQLRLICKPQTTLQNPFAGKGKNFYPVGYMMAEDKLRLIRLSDLIIVTRDDYKDNEREKLIDFAFYVPNGAVPVILQFKQNSIVQVPQFISTEQTPTPIPFNPSSSDQQDTTKPGDSSQQKTSKQNNQQNNSMGPGGLSPVGRTLVAPQLDDYK